MYSLDVDSDQVLSTGQTQRKQLCCSKRIVIFCVGTLAAIALLVGLLAGLLTRSSSDKDEDNGQLGTYRAAAVQIFPWTHTRNASILTPLNLGLYTRIVEEASIAGVDVITFPEGGLGFLIADDTDPTNATLSKLVMAPFCETVPSAAQQINPCTMMDPVDNPQLTNISCLARKHNMTIMINMCQIERCTPGESAASFLARSPHRFARSPCPDAGMYLWTSNVAFSSDGTVVAVYAKTNLFATITMSIPNAVPTSFTSSFGVTFGTFTSFDIEFAEPQNTLLKAGVQHFLHPTWWGTNQAPQLTVTMIHQAWADRWGVNLIAANALAKAAQGGGIYQAGENRTIRFDPVSTPTFGNYEIIVRDLPKNMVRDEVPNETPNAPYDTLPILPPVTNSITLPCSVAAIAVEGRCAFMNATTEQQSLSIIHGPVSCRAVITPSANSNRTELTSYTLFGSQNTYTTPDTPSVLWLESCTLMRCPGGYRGEVKQCTSSYDSSVSFDNIRILAGYSCSKFAATNQDTGTGATPEGAVLPMLATNKADIENDSQYKYEYVGKFEGSCWWSIELKQPLAKPLFSMGFYGVDGQGNQKINQ